jgi:hypothetical protein
MFLDFSFRTLNHKVKPAKTARREYPRRQKYAKISRSKKEKI